MKLINIYTLTDPRTKEVRYVGRTSLLLKKRLHGHISGAKVITRKSFCKKNAWIRELLQENLIPIISLVAVVREEDKVYWEAFYADVYKCNNLLNAYSIRKYQPYKISKLIRQGKVESRTYPELNGLKLVKSVCKMLAL
jgi:hypothetical protein